MKYAESMVMFTCCTTIDENMSINHCCTETSHPMSQTKNTSRGIRESHLKLETSIEKAAGEANYLFRAVIANQHFFKTVILPFILLAVQTPPLPINVTASLNWVLYRQPNPEI